MIKLSRDPAVPATSTTMMDVNKMKVDNGYSLSKNNTECCEIINELGD